MVSLLEPGQGPSNCRMCRPALLSVRYMSPFGST
jgi:hypothetical protein